MSVLDFQCSRVNPSKVSGLGTAVKYFPRPLGVSLTSGQPATPNATNPTGSLWLPVGASFGGKQLTIKASGTFGSDSGDPSATVTISLFPVTGTLANPVYGVGAGPSNYIATTIAITPFYAVEPWALEATLEGDSSPGNADGLLIGSYTASYRGSIVNPAAVTNIVTGLDFTNGNQALQKGAVLGFVIGVTFGTSDVTNKASMTQFIITTD
jgi:hypothetical protein